jgi:dGTP triphosphohydrolase
LVADTIASMTDTQAMRMYQRISGLSQGSVLDPILS